MKKRVYEIVEIAKGNDRLSKIYDTFMIITILISIIPLVIKNPNETTKILDKLCFIIFIIDYLIRLITSNYKYEKDNKFVAYIKYIFSPMAIIDLLSILPLLVPVNNGFNLLRLLRIFEAFRVFRIFKAYRYSKSLQILKKVIANSKNSLFAVCSFAIIYIMISAILMFNAEQDTFENFFDAIYWATTSLATIGYGDVYPVTVMGKIITMVSSLFGIAIIALPSGIITAGFMKEINKKEI